MLLFHGKDYVETVFNALYNSLIEMIFSYYNFPQVQKFIPLEGVGHCPQDEAPELVNSILLDWIIDQYQSISSLQE